MSRGNSHVHRLGWTRGQQGLRVLAYLETLALAAVIAAVFVFFAVLSFAGGKP